MTTALEVVEADVTRRRFLTGTAGAALAVGLAACGDDSSPGSDSSSAGEVPHKYGSTRVPERPRRVVALGYTDAEPLLGLGLPPVGVVDFFGERPYGKWPWERPLWTNGQPEIVGARDEFNFEKIARLRPDLIIGFYSGMTRSDYDKLSRIAPTVAQPRGYRDFTAPWQVQTRLAGSSIGRRRQADRLVADVEGQFAAVRREHPEWARQTVAVTEPAKAQEWAVFGAGDPKVQFMKGLGFQVAPAVRDFNPGGDVKMLSLERLDILDADRLVFLIDVGDQTETEVRSNPLYRQLDVAKEDRALFFPFSTTPPVGAALSFNSVISIPYGIERVVAALESS